MATDADTDTGKRDGAAVRFPPPFVPLIALLLGLALHAFVWPLPLGLEGAARYGLGGGLIVASLGIMAAAIRLFQKTGQDPKPWEQTPEIISTGIYRFTRNPMYLAMGILQTGIGVALGNAWLLVLVPPVWLTIHRIAIRHEEAYLEGKFGSVYTDYKRSVRRWL